MQPLETKVSLSLNDYRLPKCEVGGLARPGGAALIDVPHTGGGRSRAKLGKPVGLQLRP